MSKIPAIDLNSECRLRHSQKMSKISAIDLNSEFRSIHSQSLQRLQTDDKLHDVYLIDTKSKERIPSVKKLLSTHSKYFKTVFSNEGNNSCNDKEFNLSLSEDIPISIFKMLHGYIFKPYLDVDSISLEDQIKLFRLSESYKFEDVTHFMVEYFTLIMSADICWELLNLSAELTDVGICEHLGDACAQIITDLPNLVTNSKLLNLNAPTLGFLLRRKTFTLPENELIKIKIKNAWNEYHVSEVTFDEKAAETMKKPKWMENTRDEYLKSFPNFEKIVKLDENLKKKLREHQYFRDYMPIVEQYSEETQKMFILLEFTQKRKSCDAIIDILEELGQTEAANELMKYLVNEKSADVNATDKYGDTPLHQAARYGKLDVVKYLVDEKSADVDATDKYGDTPLYQAAGYGKLDVVKYLVGEKSADVDATGKYGDTPLHQAAKYGKLDVVEYLVEKGADFNATDPFGVTPLHRAAISSRLDVVNYLVDKGADFKAADNNGNTLLHNAAKFGEFKVVKYLIEEKGADVNAADRNGQTPLDLASLWGRSNVVKYLEEKAAHNSSKIF